jgi:hypothetical protein
VFVTFTNHTQFAERDHVLGLSFSPRLYHAHISIWTQQGTNKASIEKMEHALLAGLSEDLRPRSAADYYYKRHRDHDGFEEAIKARVVDDDGSEQSEVSERP